jgi:hypothetical protein
VIVILIHTEDSFLEEFTFIKEVLKNHYSPPL